MTERPRDLIPGSPRRGRSPSLDSIVSVRFPAPVLADMRRRAAGQGLEVGDWLRRAAYERIALEDAPAVPAGESPRRICGWQCAHMTLTASASIITAPVFGSCGCQAWPVYAAA